jgi:uncharacterized protein
MSLTLDENNAIYQIRAFKPGFIRVNNRLLADDITAERSLIISQSKLICDWAPQLIGELTLEHMLKTLELEPSLILLGTGAGLKFPAVTVYGPLLNQGIGVEIMDTSAACRTFNALTAEGRNVVAALIIK